MRGIFWPVHCMTIFLVPERLEETFEPGRSPRRATGLTFAGQ
jgi:hypothetical protein